MKPTFLSFEFKNVVQKRVFASALADKHVAGIGYEINFSPERRAQQANEFYDLLITFFENGGPEAVAAVAAMIATALEVIFEGGEGDKREDDGSENRNGSVNITINEIDIEVNQKMEKADIETLLKETLKKNVSSKD